MLSVLVLELGAVAVTVVVHLPLNDALKAAGEPGETDDPATVRREFREDRWVRWNLLRAVTSTAALVCLTSALVLLGRTTG